MEEELDLFIKKCKGKNYDKYDIREKLKIYLKDKFNINVDFRVCGYKEILNYVYKEVLKNDEMV